VAKIITDGGSLSGALCPEIVADVVAPVAQ